MRSFIILFLFPVCAFAQTPVLWQKTIGGSLFDELRSVKQTQDNGFILGGYSLSNAGGEKSENCKGENDFWVVKLDSEGAIQWQNTIGGLDNDELCIILQTD